MLALTPAQADEGMWTLDNFPSAKVGKTHGFSPDQAWLDRVRLSSARLARGCSGSFVSPAGLVMTNHHCAARCIEQISTATKDRIKDGFYAATLADEVRCPNTEVDQLVKISDVTARINKATAALSGQAYQTRLKAEMSAVEKECARSDAERCDVVSLYNGGQYHLYRYRRFQDVRLVFAPEFAIAFFGGDPDNFNFPRYDLDVSFVRVYGPDGKPVAMDTYLPWSAAGAQENELVFVSGHPWRTSRQLTMAELATLRDVTLPGWLYYASELRGLLTMFQTRGAEQKRVSNGRLFGVENGLKARKGRWAALQDSAFWAQKARQEQQVAAQVMADPKRKAVYGGAWDAVAAAQQSARALHGRHLLLEDGYGFYSTLFDHARTLLRLAEESPKPNGSRLREYADTNLPVVQQKVLSPAPINKELEVELLTFSLTKLREALSPDDPVVHKVLGKRSPREVAQDAVTGSHLDVLAQRKALMEGGAAVLAASKDPMLALARLVDADARAIRREYEEKVDAVVQKNHELIARARFEVLGTQTYPDATATLRLSYGVVSGWQQDGRPVPAFTTMGGAFQRATGQDPFALPPSWLGAQKRLKADTPLNMVTTNDIIGGNSGSPVINRKGQVVGLIFDGNIHSLGGEFGFDPSVNRAVSVHTAAITHALRTIYKADRLVKELDGTDTGGARKGRRRR